MVFSWPPLVTGTIPCNLTHINRLLDVLSYTTTRVFWRPIYVLYSPLHSAGDPRHSTFNPSTCSVSFCSSSMPEYLLIHPITSRCQTSEFSWFSTHCRGGLAGRLARKGLAGFYLAAFMENAVVKEEKVRRKGGGGGGGVHHLTWFSSGNTSSLLGTFLAWRTLKAARPSVIGRR